MNDGKANDDVYLYIRDAYSLLYRMFDVSGINLTKGDTEDSRMIGSQVIIKVRNTNNNTRTWKHVYKTRM